MLRYLGSGVRRFWLYPTTFHRRADWEFFAIVRGRCLALLDNSKTIRAATRSLWVFPPETGHGWTAKRGELCHVAVFHFVSVPPLLERAARSHGYLQHVLSAVQTRRVAQLAHELEKPFQLLTEKSNLAFEKALLDLTLLALEPIEFARVEQEPAYAVLTVESSLRWYSEHMSEDPKVEHVAEIVHVSTSQLRRLFQRVRQENPVRSFTKLRLQRAKDLMTNSDAKLDLVAEQCGFSSVVDFCRVFKAYNNISPQAWRRKRLAPYKLPPRPNHRREARSSVGR